MGMSLNKFCKMVKDREAWHAVAGSQRVGHDWATELKKILESPLDYKEIQAVNPKGNQPWIFDAEAEVPILWPPDAKSWLTEKDPDAGKDWRQKEKGVAEDEMVR